MAVGPEEGSLVGAVTAALGLRRRGVITGGDTVVDTDAVPVVVVAVGISAIEAAAVASICWAKIFRLCSIMDHTGKNFLKMMHL